jgi:hypothetical protein
VLISSNKRQSASGGYAAIQVENPEHEFLDVCSHLTAIARMLDFGRIPGAVSNSKRAFRVVTKISSGIFWADTKE